MESPNNRTWGITPEKDTGRKRVCVEIEGFLHFIQFRRGASRTTIITYRSILGMFKEFLKDRPLTLDEIDRYAIFLTTKGLKPKTYRCQLNCIRSYVKYLYIKDKTSIKPEAIIIPKEQFTEATFLLPEEVQKLLSVVTCKRDKAMLLVLLTSGVRVSELCDLLYEDLYENSIIVRKGKGGKPRVVYVTKEALQAYNEYLKIRGTKPGPMFPNCRKERMSRQMVARIVKMYALKAGLTKDVHTHTLRHTMATTMLRNGARLEDVSTILGHSNLRTTLIYIHFTNDYLKKAYEKSMDRQETLSTG